MPPDPRKDILSDDELNLSEMAAFLGTTSDDVLCREGAGELFSYVRPKESNDRRYPIYQLAPELGASMVRRYAEMLNHPSGATLHMSFFSWVDPDLDHLTVRELLCGKAKVSTRRPLSDMAAELLSKPAEERMRWVEDAARRCRSILDGW
jgi:hypothetical protein